MAEKRQRSAETAKNTPVPASIAGDTFKTSYAYDTIKMYGGGGAALTTGLDNITDLL